MRKEITKAVEEFHKIFLRKAKLSESKLAAFVTVLTELLTARYEKNWYPENPDRGSGYRCIRVNWQSVDPTIMESLKRAKIAVPKNLERTELTIWVDPGIVSVRIGEEGSIGTEVVDEEVYKLSQKSKTERKSVSESDEGFGSRSSSPRSSSPESVMSERSDSASPPLSRSPVLSKSPIMEYNPYSPPTHISYPHRYQNTSSPLTLSQQLPKSMSPSASHFQPSGPRSQGRPIMVQASPMVSTPQDVFGQARQAHIPASAAQHSSYTRPRALFSTQESSNTSRSSLEGFGKMAYNPYAMPINYGGNLQPANFLDIPAMA